MRLCLSACRMKVRVAQESAGLEMTRCNFSPQPQAALAKKVQTSHLGSLGAWLKLTPFSNLHAAFVSSFLV